MVGAKKTMQRGFNTHIPNILSLLRMALVLPFVWILHDIFVYECAKNFFLIITFITILASDAADGFLARKLQCVSSAGEKLDVAADTVYTTLSLATFAYFKIIPIWFVVLLLLKLAEFFITSKLMDGNQRPGNALFFDKIGKISVAIAMLLPGIFVFRCLISNYRLAMNASIYVITAMLALSLANRIVKTIKCLRA
jgi:CDP-diacylglycerol--glycerol-3-phosphate 3-phosphatidyltransferase